MKTQRKEEIKKLVEKITIPEELAKTCPDNNTDNIESNKNDELLSLRKTMLSFINTKVI